MTEGQPLLKSFFFTIIVIIIWLLCVKDSFMFICFQLLVLETAFTSNHCVESVCRRLMSYNWNKCSINRIENASVIEICKNRWSCDLEYVFLLDI